VLVCHCNKVCDQMIRQCVREGAQSIEAVQAACRAGADCGGCLPLVRRLVLSEGAALSTNDASMPAGDGRAAAAAAA
jgi:NAD(P)H-nitrite reductase large subunit